MPFRVKVAIDFKKYLEMLPDDENLEYPYRKNLNFILDYDNKTIEDISKEPHILYAYPCSERFQMLHGYTYELDYGVPVEFIKPYLRPMSSMTEKERLIYGQRLHDVGRSIDVIDADDVVSHIDWLNENMFDYRNLISMGLALKAPDGMYK